MNLLLASNILSNIGSILLAVLILLIMITIHEFGHYIAGKIFNFKINEFAIGMGPKIFSKTSKKTGEVFSVRALPLGGFCAFEGEDEESQKEGSFNSKKPWQRIIVLVAGATFNFILGVIIFTLSIGIYGQIGVNAYDIAPIDKYQEYSLVNGDTILEIDGKSIYLTSDMVKALQNKQEGDIVSVKVDNNGKEYVRKVKLRNAVNVESLTDAFPAFTALGVSTIQKVIETNGEILPKNCFLLKINDNEDYEKCARIYTEKDLVNYYVNKVEEGEEFSFYIMEEGKKEADRIEIKIKKETQLEGTSEVILKQLGIEKLDSYLKYKTVNQKFGFFETIGRGVGYSIRVSGTIFTTLGELLTGKLGLSAMGGPITTITTTSTAIQQGGFHYFLEIAGLIGVNLAVFNLLPIPALDGSRVVFCVIEWIRKKPISRKVEGVIHGVGLLLLLGFSVLVDILQLF